MFCSMAFFKLLVVTSFTSGVFWLSTTCWGGTLYAIQCELVVIVLWLSSYRSVKEQLSS